MSSAEHDGISDVMMQSQTHTVRMRSACCMLAMPLHWSLMETATIEAIARVADCDMRTVLRLLAGLPVRPKSRARIERAMRTARKGHRKGARK